MEMHPFLEALPVVAKSALALVAFLTLVAAWLFLALRVRRNKHLLDALQKLPPGQRLKALQAEMGHVTPPKDFSAAQWLKWQTRRLYVSVGAITFGVVVITLLSAYAFRYLHHPDSGSSEPSGPARPATIKSIPPAASIVQGGAEVALAVSSTQALQREVASNPQPLGTTRFKVINSEFLLDTSRGLRWTKRSRSLSFSHAKEWCHGLGDGWRLPTGEELLDLYYRKGDSKSQDESKVYIYPEFQMSESLVSHFWSLDGDEGSPDALGLVWLGKEPEIMRLPEVGRRVLFESDGDSHRALCVNKM